MVKLQSTGKQYNITIPKEHIKKLKWKKGTKLYISKHPDKDIIYIEKLSKDDK